MVAGCTGSTQGVRPALAEKNATAKGSASASYSKRMATNLPEKKRTKKQKKRGRWFFSLFLPLNEALPGEPPKRQEEKSSP